MGTDFVAVQSVFEKAVSPYEPLANAIERHGSLEWVACHKDHLNRFIILSLTELGATVEAGRWYSIEVWAGADDGHRFWRDLVAQFSAAQFSLDRESFSARLEESLRVAVRRAESLTVADLREPYLPSLQPQ